MQKILPLSEKNKTILQRLPLVGLILFFLLTLFLQYINEGYIGAHTFNFYASWEAPFFLGQILLLLYLNFIIVNLSGKLFKSLPNSRRRLLIEAFLIIVCSFSLLMILRQIFINWWNLSPADFTSFDRLRRTQTMSLFLSLLVYAGFIINRFFLALRKRSMEIAQWEHEYSVAQFELLKNQLNPHFLFNSLSVLAALVHSNKNTAEKFIGHLSKTYRYLLEHRDQQEVSLHFEIRFLEQYIFLIQQRFGKKIIVTVDEIANYNVKLLPHSVLIVMEYIISTSTMSEEKPLVIKCLSAGGYLQFIYNYHPKPNIPIVCTKQFEALRKRYSSLQKMIIFEIEERKVVCHIKLPLY